MAEAKTVRKYDAKLDSKKRITIREGRFEYYHVSEMENGNVILEPRVLSAPFEVSANTLSMMDKAMENLKNVVVSEPIDLSEFRD